VDVRGGAANESAIVPDDRSLNASVADDADNRYDCAVAQQLAADSNQHARRVRFTAWLPRHFGSVGDATRIEADFTGTDCPSTFAGRVVLTKS